MPHTMPTSAGYRLAGHPAPIIIPSNPAAALAFAAHADLLAGLHLSEGRGDMADRLSHLAHEARCRAQDARHSSPRAPASPDHKARCPARGFRA